MDASFARAAHRKQFMQAADQLAVPAVFYRCHAPAETVRERLAKRHGDASDADWEIYQAAAAAWEKIDQGTTIACHSVDSSEPIEAVADSALSVLEEMSLWRK